MSKQDEQRLLVKIATLYYSENKKQSEIASLLHLYQSFVSRALTRCQKEGLVKITVVQPTNIFVDLEKAIEERFGIRQAIVVDVGENASYSQVKHAIGSAAAHYVETRLRPEDLVGISSWSSTIRCMVDEMHPQNIRAAGVIQLLGGVGPNGNVPDSSAHTTARFAPSLCPHKSCYTNNGDTHDDYHTCFSPGCKQCWPID